MKDYYKDITQKEKRNKLFQSFHSGNSINIKSEKKERYPSLIDNSILKSLHNDEIKSKFSDYFNSTLKNHSRNESKKISIIKKREDLMNIFNSNQNNDKYSKKEQNLFLISQKEKKKLILLRDEKKKFVSSKYQDNNNTLSSKLMTEFNEKKKKRRNKSLNIKYQNKTFQTQPNYFFHNPILKYLTYKIEKELKLMIDSNSLIYIMFKTLKNLEKESQNYKGKITYKDKEKYINNMKKLQAPVLKQLFILQKVLSNDKNFSDNHVNYPKFMNIKASDINKIK